ncbi:4Fe-4S binding protein [Clostridium aestuarii]|uniref:4Fe-4S binding protein n=1 Tax=Clostridium aestuarii TaxID=338193 RepID=A0ABT4D0J4_9CLOT|nr:4Fe-4S binding protein [Clostridium aestuarii]MCY6484617.1 4Fe-4S binding protein [Clostridium aestuarii]
MRKLGPKIRWAILILSFILLVYGGRLFNLNVGLLKLPVFSCPYNTKTFIEGSCLYITEWTDYLAEGFSFAQMGKILMIYGGTFIAILLLGRLWCGYVCPFGFVQDVLYKIKEKLNIRKYTLSQQTRKNLKLLRWGLLVLFVIGVGFCEICPVRFVIPPLNGIATRFEFGLVIAIIVLGISFRSERFFCRICPLGTFIGLFHKFSPIKIKKDCTACTECGICYEACPMDIREIYTEREKDDVTCDECIMCNKCIDNCPEKDALKLTFAGKTIYRSSRENYCKNNVKRMKK